MSLEINTNLIRIRNPSGNIVFDTTRKMPIILSSLTGSVHMNPRGPNVGGTNFYYCGPAPANMSWLFPMFSVQQGSVGASVGQSGVPPTVPYCSTGSAAVYSKWTVLDDGPFLTGSRVLTVFVIDGGIYIVEDYAEWEGSDQIPYTDVAYKIILGRF